ncbi:MAG: RNA polymerase-binding protein DksA [Anaeromyxobacteraceae bacterium]
MRRREFVQYRSLLQHQLAELLGQGEVTVREMVSRDAEEIPDPNDRGTVESERNWALRLGDRDRRLATKIEAALSRLEQGTYGVCETCGKPITAGRLKARPVTTLCIDCKTESERSEKS